MSDRVGVNLLILAELLVLVMLLAFGRWLLELVRFA